MSNAAPKFTTVDDYINAQASPQRAALQALRAQIHQCVPHLLECISYNIPAFKRGGKVLVYMGAAAKHCALYGLVNTAAAEREGLAVSGRGTVRFAPDYALPMPLLRELLAQQPQEAPAAKPAKVPTPLKPRRS